MITMKRFHTLDEVHKIQNLATMCPSAVALRSMDGATTVDAKSFIGCYTLNFREPVVVESDNVSFHNLIRNIGQNVG